MHIRRRFHRWLIEKNAAIRLEGAEAFADCTIRDLSLQGMLISLEMKLPKDTFLTLTLMLSGEFILKVEVWVVWQKAVDGHNIYGLYFTKINDADKERLYQFIRQNFPQELNKKWWEDSFPEKEGAHMEDRRIFARFKVGIAVKFLDLRQNKDGSAQAVDISAKGIGFITDRELALRAPLEMWLEFAQGEPLYTRGEVAWSRKIEPDKYRVGINLEKADLMAMSRVVRSSTLPLTGL